MKKKKNPPSGAGSISGENGGMARFSVQYRAFREGGLGVLDSFYNALYIAACERAAQKGGDRGSLWMRFLAALPRSIRSFFRAFTPSFWKKEKKARSDRRGAFFLRFLPHIAVLAVAVFVFLFLYLKLDDPLALGVEIDSRRVALVQTEDEVATCISELEQNVENILGRDFTFPYPVRYTLVSLSGNMALTEKSALSDTLYSFVSDYICTASGLYLDDALCAVAADRETIEGAMRTLLADKRRETGNSELEFFNEVSIVEQAYPTSSLMKKDELIAYLKQLEVPFEERENAGVPAAADDVETVRPVFTNGALYADTQLATTRVMRHQSNFPQSSTTMHLAYMTTEVITYETDVPYTTVYEESSQYYTTMTKRTTQGVDGRERIEAKIYWVEGKEAKREILNVTVLKEPVDEVFSIGTRVLPEELGIVDWHGRFIKPYEVPVISGFGYRQWGGEQVFHYGWDLPGSTGEPIYAPASGTVVGLRLSMDGAIESPYPGSYFEDYGLFVLIQHDDHYTTLCGHCSKVCVQLGQEVKQGDKIAEIGSTGDSTGPHCHFEVRVDNVRQNPSDYVYTGTTTIYDLEKSDS